MIRLRFEKASQIFPCKETIILPLAEIISHPTLPEKYNKLIAEIPAIVYENDLMTVRNQLSDLKSMGVYDVMADNIGSIALAKEYGLNIHAGFGLNILNSEAVSEYEEMNITDITVSLEMSFSRFKKMRSNVPLGAIVYGYVPVMKMRACPGRGPKGCGDCSGRQTLTDRKGEEFILICRDRKYSELLNCVPIYTGDKAMPNLGFETLYFTIESRDEAEDILRQYKERELPDFRRTAGLYYRDVL